MAYRVSGACRRCSSSSVGYSGPFGILLGARRVLVGLDAIGLGEDIGSSENALVNIDLPGFDDCLEAA